MRTLAILILATATTVALTACGDSGSTPPTTSNSASQRTADDLRAAGAEIKAAATEAATQVGPAYEHAKEETRKAVHDVAEKVAENTATAPAPPATQH